MARLLTLAAGGLAIATPVLAAAGIFYPNTLAGALARFVFSLN